MRNASFVDLAQTEQAVFWLRLSQKMAQNGLGVWLDATEAAKQSVFWLRLSHSRVAGRHRGRNPEEPGNRRKGIRATLEQNLRKIDSKRYVWDHFKAWFRFEEI